MEAQTSPASRAPNSNSPRRRKTQAQDKGSRGVSAPIRARGRPKRAPGQPVHRRPCEQISYSDAINLVSALHFANAIGKPPTVHVTIQWRFVESSLPVADRQTRLLNKMGIWLRRRADVPPVWVYAREVGLRKGEHLHMLVHVPARHLSAFRRQMEAWIHADADPLGEVRGRPVDIRTIKPGHERDALKSYLLKEGEADVLAQWVRPEHQRRATGGTLLGKRVKVSHAIGPKERARGYASAQ